MKLRTELKVDKLPITITHHTPILFLGSCFSENMGNNLQKYKFKCIVNPFGTIFNPISIAYLLKRSVNCTFEDENSLLLSQGIWVHPNYHSQLSHASKKETLNLINSQIEFTHQYLKQCKVIFLTLGTSIAYQLSESSSVVANCHKIPSNNFEKVELKISEMIGDLQKALHSLWEINSDIEVVFTVSPVRHIKDGIVENSFSKARLHVVVDELKNLYKKVFYFPSYEWVMDDLRDYRFYEDDLIHPSPLAVKYIWERYCMSYFDDKTMEIIGELDRIFSDENHRPFNMFSEQHQSFRHALDLRKKRLWDKYPFLNL